MREKTLVLARTGVFNGKELTTAHLQEMVDNFVTMDGVPLCFGHYPKADMPKLGSVKRLWREGDLLYGTIEWHDVLAQAFDEGFFDAWSIGAHQNAQGRYYLHHLAILGEEPPAIKNLKTLTRQKLGFAASDIPEQLMYFTEEYKSYEKEEKTVSEEDCKKQIEQLQQRIEALEKELQDRNAQMQKMGQAILDDDKVALQQAIAAKLPEEARKAVHELADYLSQSQQSVHLSDQSYSLKLLKRVFDLMPTPIAQGRMVLNGNQDRTDQNLNKGAI